MLRHVTLTHVPVRHVLKDVPRHLLKHVPDRHVPEHMPDRRDIFLLLLLLEKLPPFWRLFKAPAERYSLRLLTVGPFE